MTKIVIVLSMDPEVALSFSVVVQLMPCSQVLNVWCDGVCVSSGNPPLMSCRFLLFQSTVSELFNNHCEYEYKYKHDASGVT